jgi:[ribosomal protein S18]-alanine N-acetyltransferase
VKALIRKMHNADIAACAELQERCFGASNSGSGVGFTESQLRDECARAWSRLWVAQDPEQECVLHGSLVAWHVLDELHLLNVAVAPNARRCGLGKALMHELLAYAAEHAIARIILEVRCDNEPARKLYERLGFEVTRERKAYYGGTGDEPAVDGLEMIRKLGEPQSSI